MKLEALIRQYRDLRDLGVPTALDERMAGDRSRRLLIGPWSILEVQDRVKNLDGVGMLCWRNPWNMRNVIESNLKSLQSVLRQARRNVVKLEVRWSKKYPPEVVKEVKVKASAQLEINRR